MKLRSVNVGLPREVDFQVSELPSLQRTNETTFDRPSRWRRSLYGHANFWT
jgi:hypothetical protein